MINLYAVFSTPSHEMVRLAGIKGRWLRNVRNAGHPVLIALVGALFALSFDTLSQAAFFSVTAARFGGTAYALLLAVCFMIGMMVPDAINGWWISHLLQRADARARTTSRIMGVTVALLSLMVAGLGLSRRFLPETATLQRTRNSEIHGKGCLAYAAFCVADRDNHLSPRLILKTYCYCTECRLTVSASRALLSKVTCLDGFFSVGGQIA